MKAKMLTVAAITVLALSSYILGTHAQPILVSSNPITTNWVGCLVVGKDDTVDQLTRGPHPTTMGSIQIGLRSDGGVVWRAANGK